MAYPHLECNGRKLLLASSSTAFANKLWIGATAFGALLWTRIPVQRGVVMMCVLMVSFSAGALTGHAGAEPDGSDIPPPRLPVVAPTRANWQPKFPFPFDQTRWYVTDADINAEREMCQWFDAQYSDLKHQIENLNNALVRNNGNFDAGRVQEQADAVTANIDQSEEFLAPRVQALTQMPDIRGDTYFPLYEGDSFYYLWQHLSNVSAGIKGRQPTWFTGPSFQRVLHWGSKINRSRVCS